ncbi:putative transmembrane acyltransferase [marine gamma proteobacterium HTCC2143]|uniref:Putative transmembrane acyltransferase n=1 Tax=marine gamma proteobacterium HTCC2143 TaxID=247633 RepID=A0YEL1_9GAMM|nr:putative transmembrane acyltransferase [marine gamma proteobacterium HTCC2143]
MHFNKKTVSSFVNDSHIKNEVSTLTSFRFVTAFVVFLFHCKIHFGYNFGLKVVDKFLSNGAVFMTGFFVLSGYIMCHVYLKKDFKQKSEIFNFYLKRFARIYPIYFVATIVYFIFVAPKTPYSGGDWTRIIINDLFAVQAFFPNMFQLGINGGTWSISVEAFFYFLFPLIIILFAKKPHALLLIGLALSLIITANILGESYSTRNNIKTYYSNPVMRINEFMIGISFYLLSLKGAFNGFPKILKSSSFIFLLIFGLTVLEQSEGGYHYMGLHFFLIPLFGLLIFNFHNISFGPMKNSKIINYLGRISYSFYMWQFIAIQAGKYVKSQYSIDAWYIMLIALALNIIISAISYHFIEEKFRKIVIRKVDPRINSIKS